MKVLIPLLFLIILMLVAWWFWPHQDEVAGGKSASPSTAGADPARVKGTPGDRSQSGVAKTERGEAPEPIFEPRYSAKAEVEVPFGKSVLLSAWKSDSGQQHYLLVTPSLQKAGQLDAIRLSASHIWLEAGVRSDIEGLEELFSEGPDSDQNGELWDEEDLTDLKRKIAQARGGNIGARPSLLIAPGGKGTINIDTQSLSIEADFLDEQRGFALSIDFLEEE